MLSLPVGRGYGGLAWTRSVLSLAHFERRVGLKMHSRFPSLQRSSTPTNHKSSNKHSPPKKQQLGFFSENAR